MWHFFHTHVSACPFNIVTINCILSIYYLLYYLNYMSSIFVYLCVAVVLFSITVPSSACLGPGRLNNSYTRTTTHTTPTPHAHFTHSAAHAPHYTHHPRTTACLPPAYIPPHACHTARHFPCLPPMVSRYVGKRTFSRSSCLAWQLCDLFKHISGILDALHS